MVFQVQSNIIYNSTTTVINYTDTINKYTYKSINNKMSYVLV